MLFLVFSLFIMELPGNANEVDDYHVTLRIYSYDSYNKESESNLTVRDIDCIVDENTPADTLSLFKLLCCIENIDNLEVITPRTVLEDIDFDTLGSISSFDLIRNPFSVYLSDNIIVKFDINEEEGHYIWSKPNNASLNEILSWLLDASCNRIILSVPINLNAVENGEKYTTSVDLVIWERDA